MSNQGCTAKILGCLKENRGARKVIIMGYVIPNATLYLETIGESIMQLLISLNAMPKEPSRTEQLYVFLPVLAVFGWSLVKNNRLSYLKNCDDFHEKSEPENPPLLGVQVEEISDKELDQEDSTKPKGNIFSRVWNADWHVARSVDAATAKTWASLYSNFNFWKKYTGSTVVAAVTTIVSAPCSFYVQGTFSSNRPDPVPKPR